MRKQPDIQACFATLILLCALLMAAAVLLSWPEDRVAFAVGLFCMVGFAFAAGAAIWATVLSHRAGGRLFTPWDVVKTGVADIFGGSAFFRWVFGETMKRGFYKRLFFALSWVVGGAIAGYLWSHR